MTAVRFSTVFDSRELCCTPDGKSITDTSFPSRSHLPQLLLQPWSGSLPWFPAWFPSDTPVLNPFSQSTEVFLLLYPADALLGQGNCALPVCHIPVFFWAFLSLIAYDYSWNLGSVQGDICSLGLAVNS